jgi:hypothetical protein
VNRNLTLGLVVVAALLGLYVAFVQLPRNRAADVTPTVRVTEYLWSLTADQVSGLRLEDRANGRAVELTKDAAGVWSLVEPGPQPAEQGAATSAATSVTNLTINTTLTQTTDLAPFGVLSPTYRLTVTRTDGWILAAAIGDKAPTGTSYYVLRDGEAVLLTVNAFGLDSIIGLLENPPLPPTLTPEATPSATLGTPDPVATEGDITGTPEASATP